MTDQQRDYIRDAMRPYAGMTVGIICNNATEDTMAFGIQLAKALTDAGLKAGQPLSAVLFSAAGTVIPAGVMVTVGEDAKAAANSLGLAMQQSGLIFKPVPAGLDETNKNRFEITITPNR